jgi:eukaryotic-like serine/threonine-protein kinase
MAWAEQDPVKALLQIANAHDFERSILEQCSGSRLDKVVTALDSGTVEVTNEGVRDFAFYIIFELANGDLRQFVNIEKGNDLIWVVSAIHSFCVAINQIHGIDVYHNDLKPANGLVFDDGEKVADFGRATSPARPVARDPYLCAGDPRFAPPEQIYPNENPVVTIDPFLKARAGDLYNLGSIMHYLITKRMLTPEIVGRLDPTFRPRNQNGGWIDSYEAVLPYWNQIHHAIMNEFLHLCDPDYRKRGDQSTNLIVPSKYKLERVISKLDNLKARILVRSRAN